MNTICIPLHPDGGKYKDNSELRYALRSIERNFVGEFEIAIVAKKLPDWIQGVRHIHGDGLKSSLRSAAKELPDGFFWWYDDNCLLLPTDAETMKRTPAAGGWSKPVTDWRKQLEKVRARLVEEGLPALDYSSPHGPYWFDLSMIEEAFADWPGMSGKFPVESWILSKRNWPSTKGETRQYYGAFKKPPGTGHRYLNYNDTGNTEALRRFLEGIFHMQSRFEKPDPEFTYTGRVRGVVIGMKHRPRWETQCIESMTAAGIDVEVFHGTDMHMGDVPAMPVNAKLFAKEFKRQPLAGEIGCYSSHVRVCKEFQNIPVFSGNRPGWRLVFEDDALPVNITAASLDAIVAIAEAGGYDLVLLNTGKKNRRGNRGMSISPSRRKDPFTHAYVLNEKAAKEISGWTMRHPIDLAISKSNKLKIGLLGGKFRFDQRPPRESTESIHRERAWETVQITPMKNEIAEFENIISQWSASSVDEGTEKITRHGYGAMYAEILCPLRGKPVFLLEIGVKTGASLKAWQKYLGPQAYIAGVDIDMSKLKYQGLNLVIADATNPNFANSLEDKSLDIIIDDGSHRVEDQWKSFLALKSKLKVGGRYIIEDINNEGAFKDKARSTDFRYIDTREQFGRDDLCAIYTRQAETVVEMLTIRYGGDDWVHECGGTLDAWCNRHGYKLTVLGRGDESLPCPKFQIFDAIRQFSESSEATHLMYVDADVYVHPEAPQPPVKDGFALMTDKPHARWHGHWSSWCKEHFNHTVSNGSCYYNAGVWIISKQSAREMAQVISKPYVEGVQDQHQFNYFVDLAKARGMRIDQLHPTWNRGPDHAKPAWLFHLWGPGDKMQKLETFRRAGYLPSRSGKKMIVACCGERRRKGLGNLITTICGGYAAAKCRGSDFAVWWEKQDHCGAEWSDMFEIVDDIPMVDRIPPSADPYDLVWYNPAHPNEHPCWAGKKELDEEYWSHWKHMASRIKLAEHLALPDVEPFDAISIRMLHPHGLVKDSFLDALPDLKAPFVASDCVAGFEAIRKRFPEAWSLNPILYENDRACRRLPHMQGAARDMMMLCKARRIYAFGRESTFRNLAFFGHGVPVFNFHHGLTP